MESKIALAQQHLRTLADWVEKHEELFSHPYAYFHLDVFEPTPRVSAYVGRDWAERFISQHLTAGWTKKKGAIDGEIDWVGVIDGVRVQFHGVEKMPSQQFEETPVTWPAS